MNRVREFVNQADIRRFRFWVQIAFFILLMYGGFVITSIGDTLPTFSCAFNEQGRGGICYLLPLQHQMALSWKTLAAGAGFAVLTGFVTFMLWFVILNKAWCGYACPLGTIQDWITALRKKLRIPFSRYSQGQFRKLKKIKYILLVLLIFLPMMIGNSFFGLPKLSHDMATPFCMVCPGRVLLPMFSGDFSQLAIDFSSKTKLVLTALGVFITGLFLAGSFVKKRFFCFFCPMSALHYVLSKPAFLKLKKNGDKCTKCGDCYQVCDMQIKEIADDVTNRNIMQDDCIMCLKCVSACPENGCLEVSFLKVPVLESSETGFSRRMGRGSEDGR